MLLSLRSSRPSLLVPSHLPRVLVNDANSPLLLDLESFIMTSILLRLLCHESDVAHVPHGGDVELAVGTAIAEALLVHCGVAAVGDEALCVLELEGERSENVNGVSCVSRRYVAFAGRCRSGRLPSSPLSSSPRRHGSTSVRSP